MERTGVRDGRRHSNQKHGGPLSKFVLASKRSILQSREKGKGKARTERGMEAVALG